MPPQHQHPVRVVHQQAHRSGRDGITYCSKRTPSGSSTEAIDRRSRLVASISRSPWMIQEGGSVSGDYRAHRSYCHRSGRDFSGGIDNTYTVATS